MSAKQPKPNIALAIYRCGRGGDTFPALEGPKVTCPSCGAETAEMASEPLL
jgi:rRNA maturation endonuclease Nob1